MARSSWMARGSALLSIALLVSLLWPDSAEAQRRRRSRTRTRDTTTTTTDTTQTRTDTTATTTSTTSTTSTTTTTTTTTSSTPGPAHEPSGFTLISDRDFTQLATCRDASTRVAGWDDIESCSGNGGQVVDGTGPRSASAAYRWHYPLGYAAGSAPATAQRFINSFGFTKLYIATWVRLSDNFEGHSSNTNKMYFVWLDGQAQFFLSAEGSGTGPLQPQLRLQGTLPDTRPRLLPNVTPSATIQRGRWQLWEVLLECNTPGGRDGHAAWWINGTLVSDYRDIGWVEAGHSCVWETVQLRPIWGGTGGNTSVDMDLRMDHIRISGAR